MQRYENYIDSGIEWIGEIPEHWEVKKFKRFAKICNGQDHKVVYDLSGDYPILGSGGEFGRANKFLHKGPSVLLGRKGTIDKPQYVDFPFWSVDTAYYTDICPKTDPRFFYYLCTIIPFDLYKYGSAVPSMNQETLSQIEFPSPSHKEQITIATYLDCKTTEIDRIIANKQKLIALYEEEKQAIINQAVTKGLDPTVKLKDSGVEWLGEIPEHWEVKKLKYIKAPIKNSFVDGPFGSNLKTEHFIQNGDVYVIDSGFITSGSFEFNRDFKTISLEHFETVNRSECNETDIIIAKIGANFGMAGILPKLDKPSLVSGNTLKLTVNNALYDVNFIHKQLLCLKWSGEIDLLVKGSAQPALSMGPMSDLYFAIPDSIGEQTLIIEHIEKECAQLDAITEKFNKQIDLLLEYRTTLISEVVTGKIKVPESANTCNKREDAA